MQTVGLTLQVVPSRRHTFFAPEWLNARIAKAIEADPWNRLQKKKNQKNETNDKDKEDFVL